MKFKKMISLLTGSALLMSMTACGDSDDGSDGGASEASVSYSYYTEPKIAPKAVVTENGELYMWGFYRNYYNIRDEIPNGEREKFAAPKKVMDDVKSVVSADNNHAAVRTNGDLYVWCEYWSEEADANPENVITSEPTKIMENVISFDINGIGTIAAVTDDGSFYKWGKSYASYEYNSSGADIIKHEPEKIMDNVKYVDLDTFNGALITTNGELYTWGNNKYGQLGNGEYDSSPALEPVKVMDNVIYADIAKHNCAAITENGDLYVWGSNKYGILGSGSEKTDYKPVKVMENVKYVNLNDVAISAVTNDGILYRWGYSDEDDSPLGDGGKTSEYNDKPVKMMDNVKYISTDEMNIVMTEDNEIYTWGCNEDGQLGLGTIKQDYYSTPTRISLS